jgi:hypothetical protein
MLQSSKDIKSGFLPPIIFFAVSIVFTLPFLMKWNWIGVGDWELFVTMAAVPAKTILHYSQFPFWNPYIGGGNILFTHPEVGIISPFFLLILIFGAIAGLKIQILFSYFLGFWGSYLFARRLHLSTYASYLVAFVYWGSSYFALHFSIGHIPFTHFCFLPWFLYFLNRAENDGRYIFAASLSIALVILGNGAAIPLLYTLFFSGLYVVLFSIEKKDYRPMKRYIVAVVFGLLLASVKFIPMYCYLSGNQWPGSADDFTPLALIGKAFFSFDQSIFRNVHPDQHWGWHEYSAYISPIIIILALFGIFKAFRRTRIWIIIAIFFFVFGLGHFSEYSLWNLMVQLPGFSSIRSPARGFQFVILAVAIISAIGLDKLLESLKGLGLLKKVIPPAIISVILISSFFVNLPAWRTIGHKYPTEHRFNREFRHEIGRKDDIYNSFLKNRGSLTAPWLSAYKESRGLVTEDNQVLMEHILRGSMQVLSRSYTPNRVEYEIAPVSDGTIIFGIGYDEGWSAVDGRPLFESNGLVAADFKSSDRQIILKYRPPHFLSGLILSMLSLIGCFFVCFNRKFRKRLETILN